MKHLMLMAIFSIILISCQPPTKKVKMSKEDISLKIIENQKVMHRAVLESDYSSYQNFEHPEIIVTTGDSNLNPFYVITKDNIVADTPITWNTFEYSNMEVYFSPDMNSSVLTFDADGSYIMKKTNDTVQYASRASSMWVSTELGWKILHSSYAPRNGKIGIPEVD